jgi:hypothetical protein
VITSQTLRRAHVDMGCAWSLHVWLAYEGSSRICLAESRNTVSFLADRMAWSRLRYWGWLDIIQHIIRAIHPEEKAGSTEGREKVK